MLAMMQFQRVAVDVAVKKLKAGEGGGDRAEAVALGTSCGECLQIRGKRKIDRWMD
jgi:hypothetical protein